MPPEAWSSPRDKKVLAEAVAALRRFLETHNGVSTRVFSCALDVLEGDGTVSVVEGPSCDGRYVYKVNKR